MSLRGGRSSRRSNLTAQITRKIDWKWEIASQRTLAMTGMRRKLLIQNSVGLSVQPKHACDIEILRQHPI